MVGSGVGSGEVGIGAGLGVRLGVGNTANVISGTSASARLAQPSVAINRPRKRQSVPHPRASFANLDGICLVQDVGPTMAPVV